MGWKIDAWNWVRTKYGSCGHVPYNVNFKAEIDSFSSPSSPLLSYVALSQATLHFPEQSCILLSCDGLFLSYAAPSELLSQDAPYWATQHPQDLCCTLLTYVALYWAEFHPCELPCTFRARLYPPELRSTHMSYSASSWATLRPTELRCTLLSYVAPLWATLHPPELSCILLSYAAPFWATTYYPAPSGKHCTLLS
jgi:hypothetical protein